MPFERIQAVDERNVGAVLKVEIGCIKLRMEVNIVDASEPGRLIALLEVTGN